MPSINYKKLCENYRAQGPAAPRRFRESLLEGKFALQDISIAALFRECFGSDAFAALSRPLGNAEMRRIWEANDPVLTTDFSNISGQIIYNAIMDAYAVFPATITSLVRTVQTQFDGEKIAGINQIGDQAAIVEEAAEYSKQKVTEDWINTPSTVKRGMIVQLTREAIFFDRTGVLIQRASDVGTWMAQNKEKRIINAVIAAGDSTAASAYNWKGAPYETYGDGTIGAAPDAQWTNIVAANPLQDYRSLDAALGLFEQMTDPYTGEPAVYLPNTILVTHANFSIAKAIVQGTQITVDSNEAATNQRVVHITPTSNIVGGYNIVTTPLLQAALTADGARSNLEWFMGDLARAFWYMQNWGVEVSQAPPNSNDEFHFDIMSQWKVSERGAIATVQPRAMVKNLPV